MDLLEEAYVGMLVERAKDRVDLATLDKDELNMGIEVEKEHTDDPKIAEKIALDHLAEDPKYYTKLKKAKL